jgi:hypothetical protein
VLAEDRSSAKDLFYRHLDEKTDIPLHPDWSGWLWRTFSNSGWLVPLECPVGDYQGYLVEIDEDELKDTITMAIALKNAEVMVCFEKGGDNV